MLSFLQVAGLWLTAEGFGFTLQSVAVTGLVPTILSTQLAISPSIIWAIVIHQPEGIGIGAWFPLLILFGEVGAFRVGLGLVYGRCVFRVGFGCMLVGFGWVHSKGDAVQKHAALGESSKWGTGPRTWIIYRHAVSKGLVTGESTGNQVLLGHRRIS